VDGGEVLEQESGGVEGLWAHVALEGAQFDMLLPPVLRQEFLVDEHFAALS
jgi:hypothetical protein